MAVEAKARSKENDIRVFLVKKENSKIKAFCSMRVEVANLGAWSLNGIRVIEGNNGLFVGFPSEQKDTDEGKKYFDFYHPVTKEGRDGITELILEAYEQKLASR